MDCPGQLTKRVEESEISDGCALQGTLRFQALIVMEDQEIHMNCTDPIPFKTEQDISSAITITLNLTVGKE